MKVPKGNDSVVQTAGSAYLPQGQRVHRFAVLKTRMAYRVWRRELRDRARLGKESHFRVLDVGCGPGYLLRCLETWFPNAETYGLDAEQQLLDFAGNHLTKSRLTCGRAERLPFEDGFFDVVSALQVLEHLANPLSLVAEAYRVLRPSGLLLSATPNPNGIAARVLHDRWSGYRADHISLKSPSEWGEIMTSAGFEIVSQGTTGLGGFRILQRMPFALLNWIPLSMFGYFPWRHGESYMAVARKR